MTMKVKEEERRGKRKGGEWGLFVFVAVLCAYVFCEV
jgi:hypothetical protein